MPFPEAEAVRQTVEKAVHSGLEASGTFGNWTTNDDKYTFRPSGEFGVNVCLPNSEIDSTPADQPIEKTYRFRVIVQLVE